MKGRCYTSVLRGMVMEIFKVLWVRMVDIEHHLSSPRLAGAGGCGEKQ